MYSVMVPPSTVVVMSVTYVNMAIVIVILKMSRNFWHVNSLVPDDVYRRHGFSSLLTPMMSQDVKNSLVFL